MSGSNSKVGEEAEKLRHDWQISIITASGLLMTVPLLGLSYFASNPNIPRGVIIYGLVPITISTSLFAISIYLMIRSIDKELFGLGMYATINSLLDVAKSLPDNDTRKDIENSISVLHRQAIMNLPRSYGESGRLSRWGSQLFGLALLLLVVSLVTIVIALIV